MVCLRNLILAFALFASTSAMAQDELRQGWEAMQRGDYPAARQLLEKVQDKPDAAFLLGQMRSEERYGMLDYKAALEHYNQAALWNHPGAMLGLGVLYDNGWGVERNGRHAQYLYLGAGARNLTLAWNNLAYLWARQGGFLHQALCLSAQTLRREPKNPLYLDTYGFVLLRLQQPLQAQTYFQKALGLRPDYPDALEHLGDAVALTGKGDPRDSWRQAQAKSRDQRQITRIQAKLGGASPLNDVNGHPRFLLHNPGLPTKCATPTV